MNGIKNNLDLAFDLIVLISLLIAAISGFKLGFLQSLFKSIGYIAGGVLGVFIAANCLNNFDPILIKVLGSLVIILLSALIIQYIFGKLGLLLRKKLSITVFELIDSFLGSLLSVAKIIVFYYIIFDIVLSPLLQLNESFNIQSKFYITAEEFIPKFISQILLEANSNTNS